MRRLGGPLRLLEWDNTGLMSGLRDDVASADQAAKTLGVSRRTVFRMIGRGELERAGVDHGPGRASYVTKRSLVAQMEARRAEEAAVGPKVADPQVTQLLQRLLEAERALGAAETKVKVLEMENRGLGYWEERASEAERDAVRLERRAEEAEHEQKRAAKAARKREEVLEELEGTSIWEFWRWRRRRG